MSAWIRCFTLLFCYCFWRQILLSPMLCIFIAHQVLSWDSGLSVLDAPLLCENTCEEDAVKDKRWSREKQFSWLLLQPCLKTMAATARPAMKGANSLAGGEPPTPLRKPKFPSGHFLAKQLLGSLTASCSSTLLGTGCWLWGLHAGFAGSRNSFHPILRPKLQELVCVQLYKWSAAWVAQDHIANGAMWGCHSCCWAPVPLCPDACKVPL